MLILYTFLMKKISLFLLAMSYAIVSFSQTHAPTLQSVTDSGNYTIKNVWIGTLPIGGVVENALNLRGRIKFLGTDSTFASGTDAYQATIYRSAPNKLLSYPFNSYDHMLLQGSLEDGGKDIVFVTGTTPKVSMVVSGNGNVGIGPGVTVPSQRLYVNGNIALNTGNFLGKGLQDVFSVATVGGASHFQPHCGMQWITDEWNTSGQTWWVSSYAGIKFFTHATTRMAITGDGFVGIGTVAPQSELAVNGTITTKKIKVTQTGWADFVFAKDYALPSIYAVENYIKENKHLPDVPSAAEVEKDGQDLGDMNKVLLKKVEELTLYVIELQKQVDALKSAGAKQASSKN